MKNSVKGFFATSIVVLAALLMTACSSKEKKVELRIIHTSDMHGNVYPYDFILDRDGSGSLARFATAIKQIREQNEHVLLLDGGDIFQGQPPAYYYNYINTADTHLIVKAMNYLEYDAAAVGNHDIETGHEIYDKCFKQTIFPFLAANAIDTATDKPYFSPYKIFEYSGVKVAVLGLITPAIPEWLPKHLWRGIRFESIEESATHWVKTIREKSKPDLFIALIHSGVDNDNPRYMENAGRKLAQDVPGIDIVLCGHDHKTANEWIVNTQGDSVLIIDPANNVNWASDIHITFTGKGNKQPMSKQIEANLLDINRYEPDSAFLQTFAAEREEVKSYLDKKVGVLKTPVFAENALFGTSAFMDMIHQFQLAVTDADISFAAPLKISAKLDAGDLCVRDLFQFFPYSNMLYTMELTGREIKDYLEYSYKQWAAPMAGPNDRLIVFRPDAKITDKYKTKVPTYNYSSAQGIDYVVDLSKPIGERVRITGFTNGKPFDMEARYRVAMNSYRAGGAGGHLTDGAGIDREELPNRILAICKHDQFLTMIEYFEDRGSITPNKKSNWKFIPEEWVNKARKRDSDFFFGRK